MSVQVYAGGQLIYDSVLPVDITQKPLSCLIKESLNKGGTATLTLLPQHAQYNSFVPLKTEVVIYRNGKIRWRGRSLIPEDDLYCRRTIVCEGELCFLNDAIQRPYAFNGSAKAVFTSIITSYNSSVEPWKRFVVGTVTVDATVEMDCNKAEKSYETVRKLVQNYGGYIIFDTAADGSRRINWYAELPYTCNQPITFGKNLLDYSTESEVTGFVTRLIAYGAEDEDGNRLQLNINGKDYVENEAAIEQYGVIEDVAYYDDIEAADLLAVRARLDLLKAASMPRTLKLSALDLSHQDLTLEAFAIGQHIPAESAPHGLSGEYDLVALEEDLLDASSGNVSLTRSADYYRTGTLTGSMSQLEKEEAEKARLEALARALEYREKIKKAMEAAAAYAEEKAAEAEKNANEYADDAADAAGNAALEDAKNYTTVELQKTATSLSAEISTNAGDISTLKQTATSIQSQVTNNKNSISILNQTAISIQSQVTNNKNSISTLNQTATSIQSQVTDNKNSISTINQTAQEIDTRVENAEDAISDLQIQIGNITLSVSNGEDSSTVKILVNGIQVSSAKIQFSGAVTFADLSESGATEINGDNLSTGTINADNVKLKGKFSVYNGSTLGGILGFVPGSTGKVSTAGIAIADPDVQNYAIATNKGVRMQAGDTSFYIVNGKSYAVMEGNLYVTGNVYANTTPT